MFSEEEYQKKVKLLEDEILLLKEKLKSYTAPTRSKTYYENHKEEILEKNKEYKEKTNYFANLPKEKKKEYARRAYLNKKEKMMHNSEEKKEETI